MRITITKSIRGIIGRALFLSLVATALCLPRTADAAITRVQSATSDTGAAAATSFAVTLGAAPTSGNTLVAVISTRGVAASRVSSITQTGATWTRVSQDTNTTAGACTTEIWYAPNVSGAASSITITQAASLYAAAVVIEYNGLLTPSSFDVGVTASAARTASTAASTGTTAATTLASEVAVGAIGLVNSGYTLGTPTNSFSIVATDNTTNATAGNNAKIYALEKMLSATGTVTSGGTVSTSSLWSGTVATFKERGPLAGTVTVTPSGNGYIPSAPTVTTAFTSSWALSGCQYTVNGGTNWSAGTVSGSAPNFTCTANPTGLSGTVTINMQATSSSTGTGTATAVTRTVDTAAPTDGTLSVYPGNPDMGLLWTAASDAGAGLDHYDLYFQTGATPPACGGGTLLYTGRNINYTHSGLAASSTYSYRVCATDRLGNVSSGASGTATTTARASVVNSCSSCHGYPPADNASRAGGMFQGAHNKHAGSYAFDCTVCHVSNTSFSHARGTINMASPINGNAGAAYSKGTAPAVSNTFTPGSCSNTYCHSDGTSVATGTITANSSPNWGGSTTCSSCHGFPPQYRSGSPKMNNHTTAYGHKRVTCDVCHSSVSYSGGTYTPDPTLHNSGSYNLKPAYGYVFSTSGGTCSTPGNGCHGPTPGTWGGRLGCIDCHNKVITRTVGRAAGTTLAAVTTEFGLAYGHKKAGRGAVADADCCVCHLEGKGLTAKPSAYHQDGNIDLRDPWGQGETPITNMSNGAFTFVRYSTSYAANSRTSTGHNNNADIAQVVTLRFCIRCHSGQGATNPTARSNNGGTGTQFMPWGGVNLGATYTVANGAAVAGGVVNVFTQFTTANSSYHPVRGPLNRDFPAASRLVAPYNNNGSRAGTSGTKTLSVVINCFDCHNASATALTLRTISAHGNNTEMIRGTIYAFGAASTLCTTCHSGYTTNTGFHGTGSAWAATGSSHNVSRNCQDCHGTYQTTSTAPARPIRAQDYHGSNALNGGGLWPTVNSRPYAFIRAWGGTAYHRPLRSTEFTTGSATCGAGTCPSGGSAGNVGDGSLRTYTPGGSY